MGFVVAGVEEAGRFTYCVTTPRWFHTAAPKEAVVRHACAKQEKQDNECRQKQQLSDYKPRRLSPVLAIDFDSAVIGPPPHRVRRLLPD